jgi:AcrR family transcriptional regulator
MPPRSPKRAPRAQSYHHGDLRSALIAGGLTMLEASGAEGLSLRAVAKSIGVSEAAPYHHFADKHALEQAVAAEGFRRLQRSMTAAMESGLAGLADAYIGFALAHPGLFALMFRAPHSRNAAQAELRELSESALAPLVAAVARRVAVVAPPAEVVGFAALAAWSQLHGFAQVIIAQGLDKDPARYGPRLIRLAKFFEDGLEAAVRGQFTAAPSN